MSLIVIVLVVSFLVGGGGWARVVLTDEDRYLWAVSPLAISPMFAKIASTSVSIAVRRSGRRRRALPPCAAQAVGAGTRWAMGTRAFSPSWTLCHRMLHRNQRPHWRVTAVMLLLATMGPLVGATSKVLGPVAIVTQRAIRTTR